MTSKELDLARTDGVDTNANQRATDTGNPTFDFDLLVSTPQHPSSPLTGDWTGDLTGESPRASSVGSQDRPLLIPTTWSHNMMLEGQEDVDQVLLSEYRTKLMPQCPFVIIPQHVPAAAARARHPFLMTAIRVTTSFDGLHAMRARMQLVMGQIADRMFRQAERSLDLLMGIVVILGWHHYYHCARDSQLNNLLCLAESLVSDLGLNKRPPAGDDEEGGERVVEEKRLLLGVWYLRSSSVTC